MNCNCQNCPYRNDSLNVYYIGDTLNVSFRLSEEVTDKSNYSVGVFNERTHHCVFYETFDSITQLADDSYTFVISHDDSMKMLNNGIYNVQIAFKTDDGIVNIIDNSIRFQMKKIDIANKL